MLITAKELHNLTRESQNFNLIGCTCSMDIVHFGWDHCLAAFKIIYEGKKGYPTLVFQVISSHDKEFYM